MEKIILAEVKNHLEITSNKKDDLLNNIISAVKTYVTENTGVAVKLHPVKMNFEVAGYDAIDSLYLPYVPVIGFKKFEVNGQDYLDYFEMTTEVDYDCGGYVELEGVSVDNPTKFDCIILTRQDTAEKKWDVDSFVYGHLGEAEEEVEYSDGYITFTIRNFGSESVPGDQVFITVKHNVEVYSDNKLVLPFSIPANAKVSIQYLAGVFIEEQIDTALEEAIILIVIDIYKKVHNNTIGTQYATNDLGARVTNVIDEIPIHAKLILENKRVYTL